MAMRHLLACLLPIVPRLRQHPTWSDSGGEGVAGRRGRAAEHARALARADRNGGRRKLWLRALDWAGLGFDS
jgi:hypothetical protein